MRHLAAVALTVATGVVLAGCGPVGQPATHDPSTPARPTLAPSPSPSEPHSPLPAPSTPSPRPPSPEPSTPQPDPSESKSTPPATTDADRSKAGSSGPAVQALQEQLTALGYWLGRVDGRFGDATTHAVVALQKAAGIARDGIVGPQTRDALARRIRPEPRSTAGRAVEVDVDRQLLLIVEDGAVVWVMDTSTGRPGRSTPTGTFRVERRIDGFRYAPLGVLYRPLYFHGGVAIHGYPSVPPYPASHGCVRITNPAMDWIWANGWPTVGTPVRVY